MHYYEYFSWNLTSNKNYINLAIPGHVLGFWGLKPYRWELCLYFDIHWLYHGWRKELLPNENFNLYIITISSFIISLYYFIEFFLYKIIRKYYKISYDNQLIQKLKKFYLLNMVMIYYPLSLVYYVV